MIGVFDSGIGGLTVVKAILAGLPGFDVLYFGDTARTPYGTKSPDTVIEYSLDNTEFLVNRGAKIIVIACNTASSAAVDILRRRYDIPIFEVITPGARLATDLSKKGRIGIIGTHATIASGAYDEKIRGFNPQAKIYSAACPLLVPLVEEGWLKRPETAMIVKKYLHPLKMRQIDTLILGCTHYPILKKTIQAKIGKRVRLVDSAEALSQHVQAYFDKHPESKQSVSKNGRARFFVSDAARQFAKTAGMVLGRRIRIEHIKL
jgi:glutamate racemase